MQPSQGGVVVHEELHEGRPPEGADQLRLLHLQPVQELINSFLQTIFALHATHLLQGQRINKSQADVFLIESHGC